MNDANSVVLRTNEKSTEQDGLIWKTIAVEGDYQTASVNNQKISKPMKFTSSGESNPEDNVYSLQDIKNSFDEGAFKRVAVPLDHRNKVHENTGWVKDVRLSTDSQGRACLKAGLDIQEDSIKQKILKGTIADVSMGLRSNYKRNKDGKDYKVALNHICLTNVPFLSDLDDFEFANNFSDSDENESADVYYFDDNGVEPLVKEIVKQPVVEVPEAVVEEVAEEDTSYDLRDMQISFINQFRDVPNIHKVKVEGAVNDVALVTYKDDNKECSWAVPFTAEPVNEGENKLFTYSKVSFDTINNIEEKEETPEEAPVYEAPKELTLQETLQKAHEERSQRIGLSDQTTGEIHQMDELNFSELGLDSEAEAVVRKALAAKDAQLAEHAKSKRETEVDAKITHLSDELGLAEFPGLLSYCKDVFLSDDGALSAVVNFSDDESGEKGLTATSILDGFIERLPKTAEGKLNLSEQHLEVQEGNRPEDDASGENRSPKDEADEVTTELAELGFDITEG